MGVGRTGVVMMMVAMVICLATVAHAAQGTATYYGPPYKPSACYGYQDKGKMIAAASDAIGGKKACGRKYKVTCTGPTNKGVPHPCTGKSVVVTVVDYCPPGCRATIDLSQDAFAIVAHRNAGKINIKYTQ
ncbi:EG45-like domain containing protein [Camellia lanceoleosa]|uniref:EG45-like domain containing protein n=1 Tax=Camellia lanceoleosa TaxID=1840588 RepID=A0ACC0IHN4_9ERIC|nr:EG45-like domain containing protein [Camellia lanceoleosa]